MTYLLKINKGNEISAACLPEGFRINNEKHNWQSVCVRSPTGVSTSRGVNYTFIGTGNYDKCSEEVSLIMDPKECETKFKYCFKKSDHQVSSKNIYSMSTYYYFMKSLELTDQKIIKKDEVIARLKEVCSLKNDQMQAHLRETKPKFKTSVCINGVYILK